MVVTIDNATPSQAGVWGSSTTHNFTAGSNFAVFCSTGATFANVNYYVATGSITGISTVYRNISQLVPRSLDDVTAFLTAGTEPTITAVTPSSLSFTAEGGTKTVEVTVSNQGSNTLSVSGLSGILSATISGTTVTVVATENTGDAENQTLTITLENGNSVTVPVTVAQQGGRDRKSVVQGKSVGYSVNLGGGRSSTKKQSKASTMTASCGQVYEH